MFVSESYEYYTKLMFFKSLYIGKD